MMQTVNFRLHDSLPKEVLDKWVRELNLTQLRAEGAKQNGKSSATDVAAQGELRKKEVELRKHIARYEDEGHGSCWLRDPRIGKLVEDALLHFDGQRYHLLAWCVMPNHVHVLIECMVRWPLGDVLHSWKSFTANKANEILCRHGEFWQREYLDRYIRNAEHYSRAIRYIEDNPVKAGLVRNASDWPFSSARFRLGAPASLPASEAGRDAGAPRH
jgi:putative DNA methylase